MNQDFQTEYCRISEIEGRKVVQISFSRSQAVVFINIMAQATERSDSNIKLTFNVSDSPKRANIKKIVN